MAEDKISYFSIQSRLKSIIKNQKTLAGEEDVKTSSLAKFKLDSSVFNCCPGMIIKSTSFSLNSILDWMVYYVVVLNWQLTLHGHPQRTGSR